MNIYQKVARLRDLIEAIPKDAHNDHFKFDYTSSNAVLSAVKSTMGELGLIVIPSVDKTNVIQTERSFLTEMWLTYTWINTEKPEERFEQNWYAQGKDANELGPGKAYTYAEKYLFLKLLNVATSEDDPERTARSNPKPEPVKKEAEKKETVRGTITDDTLSKIRDYKAIILEKFTPVVGTAFYKSVHGRVSPDKPLYSFEQATEEQGQAALVILKEKVDSK